MKYTFNTKIILTLRLSIILFCLFNCSCKKFVQVSPPINSIVASEVFINDQTANSAVVGLYSNIMGAANVFLNGFTTIYPGLSADELQNTVPGIDDEFYSNSITIGNGYLDGYFWAKAYSYIYQVNSCIEGLNSSNGVTSATKQQLLGEAKFMRALCYFYLVNFFGKVPLITSSNFNENAVLPRTDTAIVYQQIFTDLYDSQNLLSPSSSDKTRPSKWAASALLARTYLYQQNWIGADSAASIIIESGKYKLTGLDSVFLTNSNESIWQMASVIPGFNTTEGNYFVTEDGFVPNYVITPYLLNAFEPNDLRSQHWINNITVNGVVYHYPYKYKIKNAPTNIEANTIFRLAEIYLIRAEARAHENKFSDSQDDLNVIRTRSGLLTSSASTIPELLTAINHERQIELFGEFGHRWLDLKRTGNINIILGTEKPGWVSSAALYPIPLNELQFNPFLKQNPGY